jgi:hypothetical protein
MLQGSKASCHETGSWFSAWIGALALMTGCAGWALFVPEAVAGDPIEFSAPSIPLVVPRPEPEIKQPEKVPSFRPIPRGGTLDNQAYIMAPRMLISKPQRKTQDFLDTSSDWADNDRNADDLLTKRQELAHWASHSSLDALRDWNSRESTSQFGRRNDSSFQTNQSSDASRLDHDDRRGYPSDNADSLWNRMFSRNPSGFYDTINGSRSSYDNITAPAYGSYQQPTSGFASLEEPVRDAATSSAGDRYAPSDSRRTSDQAPGSDQSFLRAWDTSLFPQGGSGNSSSSSAGYANPSSVLAPNKPANLPFPRRPGNPY